MSLGVQFVRPTRRLPLHRLYLRHDGNSLAQQPHVHAENTVPDDPPFVNRKIGLQGTTFSRTCRMPSARDNGRHGDPSQASFVPTLASRGEGVFGVVSRPWRQAEGVCRGPADPRDDAGRHRPGQALGAGGKIPRPAPTAQSSVALGCLPSVDTYHRICVRCAPLRPVAHTKTVYQLPPRPPVTARNTSTVRQLRKQAPPPFKP